MASRVNDLTDEDVRINHQIQTKCHKKAIKRICKKTDSDQFREQVHKILLFGCQYTRVNAEVIKTCDRCQRLVFKLSDGKKTVKTGCRCQKKTTDAAATDGHYCVSALGSMPYVFSM